MKKEIINNRIISERDSEICPVCKSREFDEITIPTISPFENVNGYMYHFFYVCRECGVVRLK